MVAAQDDSHRRQKAEVYLAAEIDSPEAVVRRRQILRSNGFLRRLYEEWYELLQSMVPAGEGEVLEIGSGPGHLREFVPGLVTSDVSVGTGADLVLDGACLPFRKDSLRCILMINVLHHISRPRDFFTDAARCMRPGGHLAMIEPWPTLLSRPMYRFFHPEPFRPEARSWEFDSAGPYSGANGALPWILFERDRSMFEAEYPEWDVTSIQPFMSLRYVLSGGMSYRNLMPGWTYGFCSRLGRLMRPLHRYSGMFARIELTRTSVVYVE